MSIQSSTRTEYLPVALDSNTRKRARSTGMRMSESDHQLTFSILRLGMNDLVRLFIQRSRAARNLAERRHCRAFAQKVDARIDALCLLDRHPLAVAIADEVLDDRGAVAVDADRLQRLAAEAHR